MSWRASSPAPETLLTISKLQFYLEEKVGEEEEEEENKKEEEEEFLMLIMYNVLRTYNRNDRTSGQYAVRKMKKPHTRNIHCY